MNIEFPITIKTYDSYKDLWGEKIFDSKDIFTEYVWKQFKVPGKYELKNTACWQDEYNKFKKYGFYTETIKGTYQDRIYWNSEKSKVLQGVIFDGVFVPGFYYLYLNYCPIKKKRKDKYEAPDVWDTDLHTFLYLMLCLLTGKHAVITKTRARGFSLKFTAVLYWSFMWFEQSINVIGASDESKVKKSWRFLEGYRNFINKNTRWKRGPKEAKKLDWEEKQLSSDGQSVGLHSVLRGVSFKQSPTNDVGGSVNWFFYEEAGISKTLIETLGYVRNAIEDGDMVTGTIIVSGAVGDLTECEDLLTLMRRPESENFLAIDNIYDDVEFPDKMGMFIPDEWSLGGFIDNNGNSLVEAAVEFITNRDADAKKNKTPEQFRLYKSQNPSKPSEAFNERKESVFPLNLIGRQKRRIEDKEYYIEYLDLIRGVNGKPEVIETNKTPIIDYPVDMRMVNKEGVICVHERPKETTFMNYYASIDPISVGKTSTSNSLCAIYIMKRGTAVEKLGENNELLESYWEPDKIVCWWAGRFDDINKTNERLSLMIEWYNAWTIVENNITDFIQDMIRERRQKYLVPKSQIMFLKELQANQNVWQEYGWSNRGSIFSDNFINNTVNYLKEEIDREVKDDGDIILIKYGIERIPDIMVLKEMSEYKPGKNVDRLVALSALISFAQVQKSNRGDNKRIEKDATFVVKEVLRRSPFKNLEYGSNTLSRGMKRSPFRNYR